MRRSLQLSLRFCSKPRGSRQITVSPLSFRNECGEHDGIAETHPSQSFKPKMMSFNSLYSMSFCKPTISVHDKSNMLWYGTLSQGTEEQLSYSVDYEFDRGRSDEPFSEMREMHGRRHFGGLYVTERRIKLGDAVKVLHTVQKAV